MLSKRKQWYIIMKLLKPVSALLALTLVSAQLFACGDSKSNSDSFDYSKGLDNNGFFENVKASDYVNLPNYKGIEFDGSILTAAEDEVQTQLDGVLEIYSTYEEITDVEVKDGDTVNIDYVGSVDGVEFAGGSTQGQGTIVTIGVTSYIDDFLEQLIGHKPGDTFDVNVTFPDPYPNNTDLSGKDAVFKTTINYIQGEEISAELTNELAASYGFDSADAMMENIREWVVDKQKFEFFTDILAKATASKDIPQSVIDYVIDYDISQYEYYASAYQMTVDEIITNLLGYDSKQAYIDANMDIYEENAVQYLAAQAIAELEGLTVTDADIKEAGYTDTQIDTYGLPYIKQYILFQSKIPNYIIENGQAK